MIEGIQSISSENLTAISTTLNTLDLSLDYLELSIRGRQNTTVVNDWKNKINRPSLEESLIPIKPQEQNKFLYQSRQMSQVRQGSFTINQTVITVDPDKETFIDIVNKINASSEGVIAYYDPEKNRFNINSKNDKVISLTDDNSNFLKEMNLKEGSYLGTTDAPMFHTGVGGRDTNDVYANIENVNNQLNDIFTNEKIPQYIKDEFEKIIVDTIMENITDRPDENRHYINWGLDINFYSDIDNTISTGREAVIRQINTDSHPVVKFYSGDQTAKGIVKRLYGIIDDVRGSEIFDETV